MNNSKDGDDDEMDPTWPKYLDGKFEVAFVDEARVAKNLASHISTALFWLVALFLVLMTGTPLVNGVPDSKNYVRLIQHPDADQWWSEDGLKELRQPANVNPFTIPENEPGAKLKLTEYAVQQFLLPRSYDPYTQGLWLGMI